MNNTTLTGRIAHFSARRRWTVLAAWVIALVAAFYLAGGIGDATTSNDSGDPTTESGMAMMLYDERMGIDSPSVEYIVVESDQYTVEDSEYQDFVAELSSELASLEIVDNVANYIEGTSGVSEDGRTALLPTTLTFADDEAVDLIAPLLDVVAAADESPEYRVTTVGQGSVGTEFNHLAEETLAKGEMIGVGIALLILLVVFGAAVTAGLPIILALVSIIVAVALSAIIGRVMDLDTFVVQIITMIGLAVGIDYALFIVKRYGEELDRGLDKINAIAVAGNTAGRTVLVSGIAVMIALSGMLLMPSMTFRSFGLGAIVVVVAAIVAANTLLPALLSAMGHRAYWLRIPFIGKRRSDNDANEETTSMWDRVTGAVTAHPVISVVTTAGFLIVLSSAVLSINLGSTGLSALPDDSPSLHAFEVIDADFSDGLITSMIVIDSPNVESYEIQSGIESLLALLEVDESYGDLSVTTAPNGDLVVIDAVIKGDFSSNASRESTLQLRNEYIPATFDGTNAEVYVAGGAADVIDNVNLIKTWLPAVFGLVLVSSFLLLLVVFRSIVVPIKAVAMNALSVGAAYGLLVIVFQKGIGADLLGFQQTDTIEFWLPLFLFSILFGLSMDYHVFLLSRIKEHYDATGDNSGSVAFGLRNTAGIITGAALIMVAVFGGFAIGDLAMFQQMGFGLAAAVIIDATLIRSILVPASMELLGDWNWYFPSWLEWLPSIEMEGTSQAPAPVTPAAVPAPAISVGPATGAAD